MPHRVHSPGLTGRLLFLLGAFSTPACTGSIMDDGASPEGAPTTAPRPVGTGGRPSTATGGSGGAPSMAPPPTSLAACKAPSPGPSPLRRLTRAEYNNTIRELLGDATSPANALPPEEKGNGFGNDADALGVSRLLAEQYYTIAKGIAARATADTAALTKLLGCTPRAGDAAAEETCARTFVDGFGPRVYRRPIEAAERDDLLGVYRAHRSAGADFRSAVGAIVTTALQAPQFLYRVEVGTPVAPGLVRPSHHEMAARLSYLLWGSMPDDKLFAAARAGKLGTKEEILAEARRMIEDPRARQMVRSFHSLFFGLLGLDELQRNPTVFPTYTPELGPLFREELERFFDHVVWEGPGDLGTFFTAPYSFVNAKLAKYYGRSGVTGDAFVKVDFDPARRAGFMTSAGIMSTLTPGTHTNPVMRGVYVRSKLFCNPPPDPPPALVIEEPKPDPKATTRERFLQHQTDESCKGCHRLMDAIGFGFENYDGAGLWRTTDNGRPIDASGEIVGTDVEGTFNGPVELGKKLAASDDVRRCVAANWFTFAYGRAETEADACSRLQLEQAFSKSGWKVKDLVLALTATDAFLYRAP